MKSFDKKCYDENLFQGVLLFSFKKKNPKTAVVPHLVLSYDALSDKFFHVRALHSKENLHDKEPFSTKALCVSGVEKDYCELGNVDRLDSFEAVQSEDFTLCDECADSARRMLKV